MKKCCYGDGDEKRNFTIAEIIVWSAVIHHLPNVPSGALLVSKHMP